jgi:hypothetical protein
VLRLAAQDVAYAGRHAQMVANISALHVEMGKWIDRSTEPNTLVATNDIGAIGYFSNRRILDLEGLVTPAIVPYKRGRRHLDFLEQTRPDYLVIFPEWYPRLMERGDLFREVHRITVPRVSAAHDSLVVFSTPWQDR